MAISILETLATADLPSALAAQERSLNSEAVAWLVMWLWPSHIVLPLLLAVCIGSKRVQRHPTFLNLIVALILAGVFACILLYTDHWKIESAQSPAFMSACLAQASLLPSTVVMIATASLALVYQVCSSIRGAFSQSTTPARGLYLWLLIVSPYISLTFMTLVITISGATNPNPLTRDLFLPYCRYESVAITVLVVLFAGVPLAVTIGLQARTIAFLIKHRESLRFLAGYGRNGSALLDGATRTLAFTTLLSMALMAWLFQLPSAQGMRDVSSLRQLGQSWTTERTGVVPDFVLSTVGTLAVLVFGSQSDVLSAILRRKASTNAHGDEGKSSGSMGAALTGGPPSLICPLEPPRPAHLPPDA